MNNLTDYQKAFFDNCIKLRQAGKKMRQAQKGYEKTNDPTVLKELKKLEKEFDQALKEFDKEIDTYGQLVFPLFE